MTADANIASVSANGRRLLMWGVCAALMLAAPLVFDSSGSLTLMSQLGTLIILSLSYNMLFGQTGLLSFGHAVYSGMGAYFAVHAMLLASKGVLPLSVAVIPLVGGIAGLVLGIVLGYVSTRRGGTAFAMITMGICELVHAYSQMASKFFGGEGGIAVNRSYGKLFFGITFGPQIQVYYLIVVWLLVSTALMYAYTQTPLGRMANAVRDNPQRAEFIGYNPQTVRYLTLILSSFFAGISGGLIAINFEIVSVESLSVMRSGDGLFFTFIGGAGAFIGPIVGAIVGGLLTVKLSDYSQAWQLYLGLFFILLVMYAPGGLVGIFSANWRAMRSGSFTRLRPAWLAVVGSGALMAAGGIVLVELTYALTLGSTKAVLVGAMVSALGGSPLAVWSAAAVALVAGITIYRKAIAAFRRAWDEVQAAAGHRA